MSRLNHFLDDVTVIDLSHYLPGPFASLLLADMGASVIKIEPPAGDPLRTLGPRDVTDEPVFHSAINAGKTIMRIDLKTVQGRDRLLALAADADVLIEGFRPGAMDRLGLSDAALAAANPRLIRCSISGFGAGTAEAGKAGHDANYLAASGILDRQSIDIIDPPVADHAGAMFAAIAILGALQARGRDGRGCHVDLALADCVMPLQLFAVAGLGATGSVPAPRDNYLNGGAAYYRGYRLGDARRVVVGAIEPKFWRMFCTAAAQPQWIDRYDELMPQDALGAEIAAMFGELDTIGCLERFADPDCCVTPVVDLAAAIASPRVTARGLVTSAVTGDVQTLFPAIVDGARPATRTRFQEISMKDDPHVGA